MASTGTASPPVPKSPAHEGRNRFAFSTAIFLRLLAVIHLIAFISFWTQLSGLIGAHGILPADSYLQRVHAQIGAAAYVRLPTLCWQFGADRFLGVLCATGIVFSLLLFIDIAPAICLVALWACYLSLVNVGQIFLGFQWDALLLETTFLAIFIAPWSWRRRWRFVEPPRLGHTLLLWLLFRLMFLSGVVKLSSGDPNWRNLSALTFHYETQPLPDAVAWWMNQLPVAVQRASCAGMFTIELLVPFFLFGPRGLRHNAAFLLAALQAAVALTGNYAFFNFLTIALCLLMFDDAWWRTLPFCRRVVARGDAETCRETDAIAGSTSAPAIVSARARPFVPSAVLGAIAALVIGYTSILALPSFDRTARRPTWFESVARVIAPFNSLNNYGLFAVMTTSRPELIFEGSDDGHDWLAYEFPYKPGDLARRPKVVAPHQPRLDWQLWFAALGSADENPWVLSLCEQLLRGTPDVLALVAHNPFPEHPPHYIRVVRYDYHFTTFAERARTGNWWRRTPLDFYVESVALK